MTTNLEIHSQNVLPNNIREGNYGLLRLNGHQNAVRGIAIDFGKELLISCSYTGEFLCWDISKEGTRSFTQLSTGDKIAHSPHGIARCIWKNSEEGIRWFEKPFIGSVNDGGFVCCAAKDYSGSPTPKRYLIATFDLLSGKKIGEVEGSEIDDSLVALVGNRLFSLQNRQELVEYEPLTGKKLSVVKMDRQIDFSPDFYSDDTYLAYSTQGGTITIFDSSKDDSFAMTVRGKNDPFSSNVRGIHRDKERMAVGLEGRAVIIDLVTKQFLYNVCLPVNGLSIWKLRLINEKLFAGVFQHSVSYAADLKPSKECEPREFKKLSDHINFVSLFSGEESILCSLSTNRYNSELQFFDVHTNEEIHREESGNFQINNIQMKGNITAFTKERSIIVRNYATDEAGETLLVGSATKDKGAAHTDDCCIM